MPMAATHSPTLTAITMMIAAARPDQQPLLVYCMFIKRFVVMPSSHRRRGQDKTVLSCPRLRCERVCKLVLTQFRNMTSQFADTANRVIKRPNCNYRIQYYEQWILKQPRLLTFCKIYAYKVHFMCFLIREYDVIDVVANWKLGERQDKTQFTLHFETGQNCEKLNMFSLKIFCRRQSWVVVSSFHTADADKTRQDSLVLSASAVWNRHK